MTTVTSLTENVDLFELNKLFCDNQKSFYLHIAHYAASYNNDNNSSMKPLRYHKIENIIDCVFSPNMYWSFYNAILDTDICNTLKEHCRDDYDKIIEQILLLISNYNCPVRLQVKPTASDTQKLLTRHRFFQLPNDEDSFQYIDFYYNDIPFKPNESIPEVKIYELNDMTQVDAKTRKAEWGYVLCESFGVMNPETHGPFYSNLWSSVEVGPMKPVRMFIALKNNRVVGGSNLCLSSGIACLFNVTTVQKERGQGIGRALSLAAMEAAIKLNYRYMVLQASAMGTPVYRKLGFKPIPSYPLFIKLPTTAWYFKVIEIVVIIFGIQRLQQFKKFIGNLKQHSLAVMIIVIVILSIVITFVFI